MNAKKLEENVTNAYAKIQRFLDLHSQCDFDMLSQFLTEYTKSDLKSKT
jgi:hypothetical protein